MKSFSWNPLKLIPAKSKTLWSKIVLHNNMLVREKRTACIEKPWAHNRFKIKLRRSQAEKSLKQKKENFEINENGFLYFLIRYVLEYHSNKIWDRSHNLLLWYSNTYRIKKYKKPYVLEYHSNKIWDRSHNFEGEQKKVNRSIKKFFFYIDTN